MYSSDEIEVEGEDPIGTEWRQAYSVPAQSVCKTLIELAPFTQNADETYDEDRYVAGWTMTEWESDLYVMMTKLEDGAAWDENNSAMYSKETYYYNNREGKNGDTTGRVPTKSNQKWQVLIFNYHEDEEQSLIVEYGSAVENVVTFAALAASVVIAYAF